MLQSLTLKNFTIVEMLEVDFEQGFSVLTGETGAGKSILLDALSLLLGNKADYTQIRAGTDEAILSALFDISGLTDLQDYLKENSLSQMAEDELFIKRVLNQAGKSKNYINGQPVYLGQLKEIGLYLVDIHGQNAHHSLMLEANQRKLLDEYAHHHKLLDSVALNYHQWRKAQDKLQEVQSQQDQWQSELEMLEWKNKELSELNPQKDEWATLSHNYDEMSHRNEIIQIAEKLDDEINRDGGLQEIIASALADLKLFNQLEARFKDSEDMLLSIESELAEVSTNMRAVYSQLDIDQEELRFIETRMSALSAMAKKYLISVDELVDEWQSIQDRLQKIQSQQDTDLLAQQVDKLYLEYQISAEALTYSRKLAADKLGREVTDVMRTLSMGSAEFQVELRTLPDVSVYGQEQVVFNISANLGNTLSPIHKVASGGELSRISLALQVVINQYNQVPTLIFDEVDVGIGGKVADTIGRYLKELSRQHQILIITHLPQVAVYGHQHYAVTKTSKDTHTVSEIRHLTKFDRVQEIARMLGGEKITKLTLQHAEESLALAHCE